MHAQYSSVTHKVHKIFSEGTTQVLKQAIWTKNYFSHKRDREEISDVSQKTVLFESLTSKATGNNGSFQLLNESNGVTAENSNISNAPPTKPKNETLTSKNAKISILSTQNLDLDNDNKAATIVSEAINTNNKTINKEQSTLDQTAANPASNLNENRRDNNNQKSNEFLTNDSDSKAIEQPFVYKYGSVNYYTVLDYDFKGDYWDHNKFLIQQREQQIQNPVDINN
jgi:hypothetical protein